MSLRPPVSLIGQITITANTNDKVYWFEDGPYNLSATLTPGVYEADALVQHIASTMQTESAASGASNTYIGTFDIPTATMTIARGAGSASWYPKVTTSETANALTGGLTDTAGDALTAGQYGLNHCGWKIAASNPASGTTHTADQQTYASFVTTYPPAQDSEEMYEATVVEAIAEDGSGDVYSFTDWVFDKDEFPLYGGDWQRRTLTYQRLSQAETTWYLSQFWGPYARVGGTFRYYPDNTSSTYYVCRLTGESLRKGNRGTREPGYPLWTLPVEMRRAPV